jgi:hypothetical protein
LPTLLLVVHEELIVVHKEKGERDLRTIAVVKPT